MDMAIASIRHICMGGGAPPHMNECHRTRAARPKCQSFTHAVNE